MEIDDNYMIEGLRDGADWAYKYIYDHHYRILCFIAAEYLHDDFTAETVVADVITHLWMNRESLNITAISVRGYLVRSVRNKCMDYIKSQYHQQNINTISVSDNSAKELPSGDDALGKLLEKELESEIHRAIENLPAECRNVFRLSRIEGKKREEIAAELGISVNTVKYHLKHAIALLYDSLGKYLILLLIIKYLSQTLHYPQ